MKTDLSFDNNQIIIGGLKGGSSSSRKKCQKGGTNWGEYRVLVFLNSFLFLLCLQLQAGERPHHLRLQHLTRHGGLRGEMGSGRYRFLTSGLLLAIAPTISGYCYLLDANAKCGLCWETTYGDASDTTGVTIMKECPVGIVETWTKPPPTQMSSMQFYDVGYSLQLDTTMRSQVSQVCWYTRKPDHISHVSSGT